MVRQCQAEHQHRPTNAVVSSEGFRLSLAVPGPWDDLQVSVTLQLRRGRLTYQRNVTLWCAAFSLQVS